MLALAAASRLHKTAPHLLAHAVAERGPARGALLLRHAPAVEHVEILQYRIVIARHSEDAQEFASRAAWSADLPAPDGVGLACRQSAELGHIDDRKLPPDGFAKVLPQLLEFGSRHDFKSPQSAVPLVTRAGLTILE